MLRQPASCPMMTLLTRVTRSVQRRLVLVPWCRCGPGTVPGGIVKETRSNTLSLLLVFVVCLGLCGAQAVLAQPDPGADIATPLSADDHRATPVSGTPVVRRAGRTGIASRVGAQQAAAQAPITAYATVVAAQATQIANLQASLGDAQVTATALAVVAANTVLDPTRQTITVQTDLEGMLADDEEALTQARFALSMELARFPTGCRAGFMLISGKAPTIEDGVALASRTNELLRAAWPAIFDTTTGSEVFALPNEPPAGEVSIDIFFYSGCLPAG